MAGTATGRRIAGLGDAAGSRKRGSPTAMARRMRGTMRRRSCSMLCGCRMNRRPRSYRPQAFPVAGRRRVAALLRRRIDERLPSAYLTGVTWFAGHEIRVTPDVLVPRSPIAELCLNAFEPWIDADARARRARHRHRFRLHRDRGGPCVAEGARVDATDVSPRGAGAGAHQCAAPSPRASRTGAAIRCLWRVARPALRYHREQSTLCAGGRDAPPAAGVPA